MWPILRRLMERHEAEKAPIVMDWWLFNPDLVAEVSDRAIQSVWLHIDPDTLDRRERSLTGFRAGSRDPERMHANFMHRSLWRNELVTGTSDSSRSSSCSPAGREVSRPVDRRSAGPHGADRADGRAVCCVRVPRSDSTIRDAILESGKRYQLGGCPAITVRGEQVLVAGDVELSGHWCRPRAVVKIGTTCVPGLTRSAIGRLREPRRW